MRALDQTLLKQGVLWTDQFNWQNFSVTSTRTTAGGLVVSRQKVYGGQPVTLVWRKPYAWLLLSELQEIREVAQRESIAFVWDGFFSIITLESAAGFVVEPAFNTADASDDRFYLTLKFITLG